jgi:uncharacterized protein
MHWLLTGPLTVERVGVSIAGLPEQWRGLKLVQLSDLHYDGVRLSEALLAQAIEASNQAEPDLVLLTGDLVTDNPAPIDELAKRLKRLQSRFGVYAILGNHDNRGLATRKAIIQGLQKADITVLWNQVAYPLGNDLALVGLADFWSKQFNPALVMAQVAESTPRIVLSHNPDTAEILQQWRVDLQLSGHTHGGQIVLPGLGNVSEWYDALHQAVPKSIRRKIPFMKKSRRVARHWEWAQGLHQVGNNLLYVNRGLGTYFPGRFFCSPEVTVLTLEPKA